MQIEDSRSSSHDGLQGHPEENTTKKECNTIELLVNLLCHDVRPVDHAGAKVEINGTRTASLVDDRHHRIVVVQSNFADVRFVGE